MGSCSQSTKVVLAIAAVALAIAAAPAIAAGAEGPGCNAALRVVVHHAGGADAQPPAGTALPAVCATDTGYATSETTIAATGTGALLFSPAHTENSLARSSDGGATWGLTYPPKMQYTSLWNTVDPIVTVDRSTGRAFWLRATGELRTAPVLVDESPFGNQAATAIAYAHGFQVYSTPDDGRTWTTADYQHEFTGDWEKIFVGPAPAKSSGAPQPSGYPDVAYVCANAPFEVSGPGRACYRSLDGGATFNLAGYVFPSAGSPSDDCPALAANAGVVGSDGTTYQPQTCSQGSYIAVSKDEGSSYSWLPVTGAPGTSGLGGGIQLAIDGADNLYALWQADQKILVAISRDHGRTWLPARDVTAPGLRTVARPSPAAGAEGEVGVVYYGSTQASAEELSAYVTQTRNALDAQPVFYSAALNDPARPIFHDYAFNASPRADYVGATYDATGTLWAGVVKQLGKPNANNEIATTGYVGRLVDRDDVGLPASRGCVDRRKFSFTLHHAPHARVTQVEAFVNGRRALARHARAIRTVTLRRLPRGRFQVKIVATQSTGSKLVSTRSYRGCTKSRPTTTRNK
jgi:hypothetical protein